MKGHLQKGNYYGHYFANTHLFDEAIHSKTNLNHNLRILKLLFKAVLKLI